MADKKISALTAASTPLAGTEVLPIVQSGSTVKVSATDVTAGRDVSAASIAVTGSTVPVNGVYLSAANTVALASNSTTAVRIDSGQRVLVNATARLDYGGNSGLVKLQAQTRDSSTNTVLPALVVARTSTGTPAAGIGARIDLVSDNAYSGVSEYGSIAAVATDLGNISGDLAIYTMLNNSSTEKWRFDSGGNLIQKTAAKGINFTANTAAAGMTSQLLNWYEEGTWTPTLSTDGTNFSAVTYNAVRGGSYVRVGKLVHIQGWFYTDSITVGSASGNLQIGGLPFTAAANSGSSQLGRSAINISYAVAWAANTPIGGVIESNTTTIWLVYRTAVDGSTSNVPYTAAGTGGAANRIGFSGTYVCA